MSISYQDGDVCPVCEIGVLEQETGTQEFSYKGSVLAIEGVCSFSCRECGETLYDAKEEKRIERLLTDRRRKVDGFLTSQEIKSIRNVLGYTQLEMAKFLGVGEKNFARYETGASTQSKAMDNLLRIVCAYPRLTSQVLGDAVAWETFKVLPFVNRGAKNQSKILVPYDKPDWACQNE